MSVSWFELLAFGYGCFATGFVVGMIISSWIIDDGWRRRK